MKKINTNGAIVFISIVIGFTLLIAGPHINWKSLGNIFKQQQIKYEKCLKICDDNNTCITYDIKNDAETMFNKTCVEWSKGACQNICVEKYK